MKYLTVLIIVLIPLTIIFTNASLLVTNYSFFLKIYREQNIYINFSDATTLNKETNNVIGYFRGNNLLDVNFYSVQAISHLKDVKNLLNIAQTIMYGSMLLLIFLITYVISKKELENLRKAITLGAALTIILTIVVAATLIVNFQNMFIYFHLALFRNNYWLFEESDNLIKMFPQKFFVSFAGYLASDIIATAIVLLLACLIIKKINDKPHV